MFTPTSRKFFDEFTGTGGAGVDYLNALQGDKITCVIQGYFSWQLTNQKLIFSAADKTITIAYSAVNGLGQNPGFVGAGFTVGTTFAITGTASNNAGTRTIASVTNGVITTVEALVDETASSGSVYGTQKITDMDFMFNLIANNANENSYNSLTDLGTVQKYSATGLDASVVTPVPLKIATKSFGWVTDIVTNDDEGEGFVEGVSITDYKQYFKITTVFYMTRIWTKELLLNFLMRTAPPEYTSGNHLKHICQIDGKFDPYDPLVSHTGSILNQKGQTGWYNQSNSQGLPEYSFLSIQYQNPVSEYIDQIEGSDVTTVTMAIFSRSGRFVAGTTKFILNHFLCPLNPSAYIGTETTLLENIRQDKAIITMDAVPVDGINFLTDYQSLTNIRATFFDANNVVITFDVDYSSETKTIMAGKTIDDRLYGITLSCQNIAIATTKNIDRVNVIGDFRLMDFDLREAANFQLIDYIHCFTYPNYGVFEVNNITGFQGDPSYVEIPFRVESDVVDGKSPTIQKVKVEIVATKTDNADFVVESKVFDPSNVRKLNDKQTIEFETSRDFILPKDSPWNRCNLIRDEPNDSGSFNAYLLQYAFVLRYEEWLEIVQSSIDIDIFKDIPDVVQAWKRFNAGYGWELKFRMTVEVVGYNGATTEFQTETEFTILEKGDTPEDGNLFLAGIQYFNEDGDEIAGVVKESPTRIRATFKGDPTIFPAGMEVFNGYIFTDTEFGDQATRRIACSDFDSEKDSPFTTVDLPTLQGAVDTIQSANLRLSIFNNYVVLDTWFVPDERTSPINRLVVARLGYNVANIILQEDGAAIMQEDRTSYILTQ